MLSAICTCFLALIMTLSPLQLGVAVTGPSPVQVNKCAPHQGQYVGGPVGFVPAYYPVGPYYWRDAWGYNYMQAPYAQTSPQLKIDYMNVTPNPLKEIEFGLIAKGTLVAEVRDVGTFTQGAEIKHSFGLSHNVFPLGTGLPQCVALRATFADGTKWVNPHLPHYQASLYR